MANGHGLCHATNVMLISHAVVRQNMIGRSRVDLVAVRLDVRDRYFDSGSERPFGSPLPF